MNFKKIIIYIFLAIVCLILAKDPFIRPINSERTIVINPIEKIPIPIQNLDTIIKEHVEPISVNPSFGGKPFCDYKIIDSEKNNNTIKIYFWLIGQEYYVKNNKLVQGTGGEFSAVLTIKQENNNYKFINCNISRAEETEDSLKIFPENIRKKALDINKQFIFNDYKIHKNAEAYFKINKN